MNHKEQSKAALARLAALAEQHGVSQTAIADVLGVRPQTVQQVFAGRFHPTLDNVFRYLNALNGLAGTSYTLKDIEDIV